MKRLIQKILIKTFEKCYSPSLYIKLASSLYAIPQKTEHTKDVHSAPRHILQGVLNGAIIPFHLNRIWPHWVYRQFNPKDPFFTTSGLPSLALNVTQRNWTIISTPENNEKATIDPHGLITPMPHSWSLDFWINHNNILISPSQRPDITQHFSSKNGALLTTFQIKEELSIHSEAWFTTDTHQQGYIFNKVSLQNTSTEKIKTSLYFAVRPYNPEGIAPISEICYLTQQGFVIDNRLGVVFDQTPDNVVCLNFEDGNINEEYQKFQMIIQSHCPNHLANAFVEYKLELAPNEKKSYTCKLPTTPISPLKKLFQKTLPKAQIEDLAQKVIGTRNLNYQEKIQETKIKWENQLEKLGTLNLPDTKLETLYKQNIIHLLSAVGKNQRYTLNYNNEETDISQKINLILALNRCGDHEKSEEVLNTALNTHKKKKLNFKGDDAGKLLYALKDIFLYTHNHSLIKDYFPKIELLVTQIKKYAHQWSPHSTFNDKIAKMLGRYTSQEEYLHQYFWAMSGLKCAAEMADSIQQKEDATTYYTLYENMTNALKMLLLFSMGPNNNTPNFIPISTKRLIDSGLVMTLNAVYPLGMVDSEDEKTSTTLDLLDKYSIDSILFNTVGHAGYNVSQNCQLAQVYVLRKDARAWKILRWIRDHASETGTWPDYIHPYTKGGSAGEGHSLMAGSDFIQLLSSLIVKKDGFSLHFFSFIPPEWLEGNGLSGTQWPTAFGKCDFSLIKKDNEVRFKFTPYFTYTPMELRISIPLAYKNAIINGVVQKHFSEELQLEAKAQEVIFTLT